MAGPEIENDLRQIQEQLKDLMRLVQGPENSINLRVNDLQKEVQYLKTQNDTLSARIWQVTSLIIGAIITATFVFKPVPQPQVTPQPQPSPSLQPSPSPSSSTESPLPGEF